MTMTMRNSEFASNGAQVRRGRKPRPPRCVVQLRQRMAGKVTSICSMTVDCTVIEAMKRLQVAFEDCRAKFERATDDPRW